MAGKVWGAGRRSCPAWARGDRGGRVDLLYGEDFPNATSLGWEVNPGVRDWNSGEYYGIALPQLYGEVGSDECHGERRQ